LFKKGEKQILEGERNSPLRNVWDLETHPYYLPDFGKTKDLICSKLIAP
jgi:hypothetical protein